MKCYLLIVYDRIYRSLPPRGAWIEILAAAVLSDSRWVAPPAGSVD